MSSVHSDSMLV